MIKVTHLAAIASALLVCGSAQAEVITVKSAAGSKEYETSDIKRIAFSEDGFQVVMSDATGDTYAFDDATIVFGEAAGVQGISAVQAKMTVFVPKDGSFLKINGFESDENARVELYNIAGSLIKVDANWNGSTIDINSLPNGTYILRVNGKTAKFRK